MPTKKSNRPDRPRANRIRDRPDRASVKTIEALQSQAARCRACDLYKGATQTVFGEGDAGARIVLVGEQPGHEEDLAGRPFVGPAGRLLDQALEAAGIDRRRVYVTNVVKHFKWKKDEAGGKRRIHERPNQGEVEACRPWFEQELRLIRPRAVVCLGVTAASAFLRRHVTISASRGQALRSPGGLRAYVTLHPSAILRMPDEQRRKAELQRFVDDLRTAAQDVGMQRPGRDSRKTSALQ
jgi:uracil-DNA glycosylase family protein